MSVDFLPKNFPPFQVHHAKKPPRFYPDGFQRNVIDFYFIFSDCRLRKALYLQFSYFIWPLVLCSGKEYYVDFTHNITRNPHKATGALRAVSYSYQFTLLGVNDAAKKYGTTEFYGSKVISSHSLDRNEIEAAARSLEKRGVLETHWNPNPIIPSVFIING